MKKVKVLLIIAIAMISSTAANAQIDFGVKGGLNVTNMSIDSKVLDASNRTGFFIGPTVKFTLPIVGIGLDASALYDQREGKLELNGVGSSSKQNVKQQQIAIPINLRYGFGLGDMASIYFFAGPQFAFAIGNKDQSIYNDIASWTLKDSNFSINLGIGTMLVNHLQISANYNIACGTTAEVTPIEATQKAVNTAIGTSKAKNGAWQIGLAYYF